MEQSISVLTILWSMCAAVCFLFAAMHLALWLGGRRKPEHVLSAVMALAAGCNVILEMFLLLTTDAETYVQLLKVGNVCVFVVLLSLIWLIRAYLEAGSRWLMVLIAALWVITLFLNVLSPGSVVFSEITELQQVSTFWGESFTQAIGVINPWKIIPDIASVLILIFLVHATWVAWRRDRTQRIIIAGGSSVLFILLAGIHTPLVDAGIVQTPYMIGFAFMAIVAALTYQLVVDALITQTDLELTRREMERLTRAVLLGEIAAGLAHELNQPLSAILSNAQAARRFLAVDDPDLAEIRDIVNDIIDDDKRAGEVIHGLRNMLRSQTSESQTVDVNAAIEFVAELLAGELTAQHVSISRVLERTLPDARGDKVQVQQVIMNLMLNAAKAMRDTNGRRQMLIESKSVEDGIMVSLSDTGSGLDSELLPKLFQPFVPSQTGGLGMGLAICRRIIERHGGRIWVESASDRGTEFRFILPQAGNGVENN